MADVGNGRDALVYQQAKDDSGTGCISSPTEIRASTAGIV
jgi:hypothetical protein